MRIRRSDFISYNYVVVGAGRRTYYYPTFQKKTINFQEEIHGSNTILFKEGDNVE